MRTYNIIHNDLHCGNILLDFNSYPIIHDFGATHLSPINEYQLYLGDSIDFFRLMGNIKNLLQKVII
jgi:predicted unusual protein kinase regulating ubiquinone biosynthesis (AarF/ABC1/UbiB family)